MRVYDTSPGTKVHLDEDCPHLNKHRTSDLRTHHLSSLVRSQRYEFCRECASEFRDLTDDQILDWCEFHDLSP